MWWNTSFQCPYTKDISVRWNVSFHLIVRLLSSLPPTNVILFPAHILTQVLWLFENVPLPSLLSLPAHCLWPKRSHSFPLNTSAILYLNVCSALFLFFNFFYFCSVTVAPNFPPLLSPALPNPHFPHSILPPMFFVHGSFIHFPWFDPFPYLPHYPSPSSSLVTDSLFTVSMSLVLFGLLACFVD